MLVSFFWARRSIFLKARRDDAAPDRRPTSTDARQDGEPRRDQPGHRRAECPRAPGQRTLLLYMMHSTEAAFPISNYSAPPATLRAARRSRRSRRWPRRRRRRNSRATTWRPSHRPGAGFYSDRKDRQLARLAINYHTSVLEPCPLIPSLD
jgi:hypothetical protein